MNTLQHVIDLPLQQHPHGTNAAFVRCRATFLVHGVRFAVQVEGGELGRVDYVPYGYVARMPGKLIATLCPPRTTDDPGAPHPQKDLLDVVRREALGRSDVTPRHRHLVTAPREMQRADQAILGPRRYSHVFTIDVPAGADKSMIVPISLGVPKSRIPANSGSPVVPCHWREFRRPVAWER